MQIALQEDGIKVYYEQRFYSTLRGEGRHSINENKGYSQVNVC